MELKKGGVYATVIYTSLDELQAMEKEDLLIEYVKQGKPLLTNSNNEFRS
jgi:hypothetical protein